MMEVYYSRCECIERYDINVIESLSCDLWNGVANQAAHRTQVLDYVCENANTAQMSTEIVF